MVLPFTRKLCYSSEDSLLSGPYHLSCTNDSCLTNYLPRPSELFFWLYHSLICGAPGIEKVWVGPRSIPRLQPLDQSNEGRPDSRLIRYHKRWTAIYLVHSCHPHSIRDSIVLVHGPAVSRHGALAVIRGAQLDFSDMKKVDRTIKGRVSSSQQIKQSKTTHIAYNPILAPRREMSTGFSSSLPPVLQKQGVSSARLPRFPLRQPSS